MADIPVGGSGPAAYRAQGQGREQSYNLSNMVSMAGAVLSLALIGGIGYWGYKTLSRDVSGVPIVRAASKDPMRVAPENPGGRPASHQGYLVNNVAANGAADGPSNKVILAPAPVDLTADDVPGVAAVPAPQMAVQPVSAPKATARVKPIAEPKVDSIKALADRLAAGASPLGAQDPASGKLPEGMRPAGQQAAVAPLTEPKVIKPSKAKVKGGIKVSLRPVARPTGLRRSMPRVAPVAATNASAGEVDVASVPAGARLVQLGAYDSPAVARKEWGKMAAKFDAYLEGKSRVVQKATSGGRTFYRLRAMGFADLADSRRFCAALVAEKVDCIPVVHK